MKKDFQGRIADNDPRARSCIMVAICVRGVKIENQQIKLKKWKLGGYELLSSLHS